MVDRRFVVRHNDDQFSVEFDTGDGLEVLKSQIFSLTSVPPDDQKILAGEDSLLVTESSDLEAISEKLCLVSIQAEEQKPESVWNQEESDEKLARRLQAEEEALFFQQYTASGSGEEFKNRVQPYVQQVLMYEDPVRQEAARKSVPIDEIEEKALVSLAKEGNFSPSKDEKDFAFLLQLLFWFKQSFRWVNSPPCDNCGGGTNNIGMGTALPSEIKFGGTRVELYRCNFCSSITRFPRYNDPLKLLETRRGRCGEWANCFTLYCRAFGYESRLILDFTDHVWTECFSHFLGRWMHLDPCEGLYDNPLLYEKGWNKKLNYIIAIAKDGVYDVTKRYTRKWHEVLSRRNITTEASASAILSSITKECRAGYSFEALSVLEYRDKIEAEELERGIHLQIDASISLPGRQSGDVEWRKARSELGSNENNSYTHSSCPVRICVDAHVRNIYNAFVLLLTHFLDNDLPKAKTVEVLEMLKRLLLDLRNISFRQRRSFLNQNAFQFSEKMMHCLQELFSAISLKGELENDGKVCISLAGDPVHTSIALPVAIDVVDEIIDNYKSANFSAKDVQFPKVNRLCSGRVLASGEELPIGIATSAFDGIRLSKWEEPNGAKGCWLIYKVIDDQMYDLESYDLTSANDASERDPMDWIVEGSDDGGSSWSILDKRSSQTFEKRFQRKTFRVGTRRTCNAFRFHFLVVKDPEATSRFQIGSIDLYGKSS
ncbi:peptide-N(4)-(N-acetyl-beta-glucosaminyl)asparagine amidase [Elaeis guineensis]|uniref:Peptide-N(4)-(N-acetyl-beta- glucosaminyl)asparagine amidase isoform X1 n=1 Tax=Elaeis guineensis var. tenera TaxID=51953 RepID=A0A6I9RBK8_ELAGV|nr:peptide-N(4)-(N-acetyl-beta-glucosaminyl)asparagine amidase isoform X1 [Elaeis guineensis]